jgi:SAM-dependent methyltransferase
MNVHPVDIATRETVAFLSAHLRAGAQVVEVGCGEGHVAKEFAKLGYRVIALDSDAETVAKARARRVDALQATWPDFTHSPVDAVCFTRSLHHVGPLDAAIARAHQLVAPGGVLLVEDFDFEAPDGRTLEWFAGVVHAAGESIDSSAAGFVSELLAAGDPVATWRGRHGHDIHGAKAMEDAIAARFDIRETARVPYLYRYLIPSLPANARAAEVVDGVLSEEAALAKQGDIVLVGRRIVAVR